MIRVFLLLLCLLLHFLTPGWYMSTGIRITDWLMIATAAFATAMCAARHGVRMARCLTLVLCVNAAAFFITTVQLHETGLGDEHYLFRMAQVCQFPRHLRLPFEDGADLLNACQLVVAIVMSGWLCVYVAPRRRIEPEGMPAEEQETNNMAGSAIFPLFGIFME